MCTNHPDHPAKPRSIDEAEPPLKKAALTVKATVELAALFGIITATSAVSTLDNAAHGLAKYLPWYDRASNNCSPLN